MAMQNLTVCDQQHSVLASAGAARSYSPYGALSAAIGPRLAYCGQAREASTGFYQLGNGYRVYDPCLMRFLSPDVLSPFAKGGINAYAYCAGDPINYQDRNGRARGRPSSTTSSMSGLGTNFDWGKLPVGWNPANNSARELTASGVSSSTPHDFTTGSSASDLSGVDHNFTDFGIALASGAAGVAHAKMAFKDYKDGNIVSAIFQGVASATQFGGAGISIGHIPMQGDPIYEIARTVAIGAQYITSTAATAASAFAERIPGNKSAMRVVSVSNTGIRTTGEGDADIPLVQTQP